jgi:hypothetical protein
MVNLMQNFTKILKIIIFYYILIFPGFVSLAQKIEDSVRVKLLNSMKISEQTWNSGDLEQFMHNYWKSDSLRFITKKGVTYGWQNTLNNYIKGYPDKEKMGQLKFDILSIEYLNKGHILMIGKWQLTRKTDTPEGYFSLIWKLIDHEWVIVVDHSS